LKPGVYSKKLNQKQMAKAESRAIENKESSANQKQ